MKKTPIIVLFLIILSIPLYGQMHQPMMPSNPKMESMMIYHMTEYLDLSPEQAEIFFPKMREHQEKMREHYDKIHELCDKTTSAARKKSFTEKNLQQTLEELRRTEDLIREEREQYIQDLEPVLTPSQRAKLLFFDEEFRKQLRMKLKQSHKNNRGRNQ